MRRLPAVLLLPLAMIVIATGCSRTSSETGRRTAYAANGTFTMSIKDDIGPFDPYHNQLMFSLAYLAYDSLVNMQPDGTYVSGLAEKWNVDADSATFVLRAGVTCSDGTPLTAGQVAAAITYVSNPKNQSTQYGVNMPTEPLTATADDATRTVKVVMKEPFGFLLNTVGQLPIVCARGLKDRASLKSGSDGTGPFVLTSVVPGQRYTLTRRDGYVWGPKGAGTSAPGTPASLVLRVVPNETTAANLLLSGELNLAEIPGKDQERLSAQGLDSVARQTAGAWLWFNQIGARPTADKRVRQALVGGLDLGALVKVSTGGSGRAATGLVANEPKACAGDTIAGRLPAHDVTAAAASLDEAGWAAGADGVRGKDGMQLSLNLHYAPSFGPDYQPTAELIAQEWRKLGIQVKLTADSNAAFNQVWFQTSNYDVYLFGNGANLPSQMVPYLSGPNPPNGTNLAGIDNSRFNSLVAKARTMAAPQACALWNQAEQALWQEIDPVPISIRSLTFYLHKAEARISGFYVPVPTSLRVFE